MPFSIQLLVHLSIPGTNWLGSAFFVAITSDRLLSLFPLVSSEWRRCSHVLLSAPFRCNATSPLSHYWLAASDFTPFASLIALSNKLDLGEMWIQLAKTIVCCAWAHLHFFRTRSKLQSYLQRTAVNDFLSTWQEQLMKLTKQFCLSRTLSAREEQLLQMLAAPSQTALNVFKHVSFVTKATLQACCIWNKRKI